MGVVLSRSDGTWWSILWSPERASELHPPGNTGGGSATGPLRLEIHWPRDVHELRIGLDGESVLSPEQLPTVELAPDHNIYFSSHPGRYRVSGCEWLKISDGPLRARAPDPLTESLFACLPPRRSPSPVVTRFAFNSEWTVDKPSESWGIPPDTSAAAKLEFYNFSEEPRDGTWALEAPEGWTVKIGPSSDESAGTTVESRAAATSRQFGAPIHMAPLTRLEIPLRLYCGRQVAPGPARLSLGWEGHDGSADSATVLLAPKSELPEPWWRFRWQDFMPRPDEPEAWQVFEISQGTFSLEVRSADANRPDALLFLALPEGIDSSDVFSVALQCDLGPENVWAEVFLLTPRGEVWRHGDWQRLKRDGIRVRAVLRDFAPTIWSRHRSLVLPAVKQARWLAIRFQGVARGQVIEIAQPALSRPRMPSHL